MVTMDRVAETKLTEVPQRLKLAEGWADLRAAIQARQGGTIDGAWGSSAAASVVALSHDAPGPLLVVLPSPIDLPPWTEDIRSFSGTAPAVFPAYDGWPNHEPRGRLSDETTLRLRLLQQLLHEPPRLMLTTITALVQPVPPRADLASRRRHIQVNQTLDPDELLQWLLTNHYKRTEAVEYPGEFARRGGIVDIFPPDALDPLRLEFFGDELESIRQFNVQTQRSLTTLKQATLLVVDKSTATPRAEGQGFLTDYLPETSAVVLVEPSDLKEQAKQFFERVADVTGLFTVEGTFTQLMQWPTVVVSAMPRPSVEVSVHLRVESVERFSGNVLRVKDELDAVGQSDDVLIACQTEAEIQRLQEVLKTGQLAEGHRLHLVTGHVRAGFRLVGAGLVVLGSHQLFHREAVIGGTRSGSGPAGTRGIESRAIDSFLSLNEGDYVVHVAHGIARFRGMRMLEKGASHERGSLFEHVGEPSTGLEENLVLEFRDNVLLYVPASRIDLVQRYVGGSQVQPELSKLGGVSWGRKKQKVAEAVRDMAAEMLQLQAVRATIPGTPLAPDTVWQREFEASFPYQETPDQATAIAEIKADLEKPKPMDRLLCGDVGFGKTEVALRACFKAIDNGKQVAVLVPTTVLAEQHYRTFTQRLAEYPFCVEVLSRFKSAAKQKDILKRVASGEVDIVIGTHRLVSNDVKFHDLGLVVIDEEQRFGVEHKEQLKKLRAMVHVLTMTATPIPRTLHAGLMGLREISNLETPPPDRYPVETRLIRWDKELIRHAILREMNRGGQVYFVHNRVHDILEIQAALTMIVPEAKIVVGHGQMAESELEQAMIRFVNKEADILLATTIIESGLDIPNANTIFIDEADLYGLADLHQLRGRVGRTRLRAYAYLIVHEHKLISPNAQKRLKAIEEFAELGSGFKIAMRDLEIRGAGNILGAEQSGHIAAVGYELYCTLLENAVRQLKNQPPKQAVEVNVDLPWPAFLPKDYVPGQKLRIEVYRRLARIRELSKLADFRQELQDRYGPIPEPAEWLLRTTEIRLGCARWQISSIHRNGKDVVFSYKSRKLADRLANSSGGRLKVVDEKSLYWRIPPEDDTPDRMYELLKVILKPVEARV